jgi:hypothetical protein
VHNQLITADGKPTAAAGTSAGSFVPQLLSLRPVQEPPRRFRLIRGGLVGYVRRPHAGFSVFLVVIVTGGLRHAPDLPLPATVAQLQRVTEPHPKPAMQNFAVRDVLLKEAGGNSENGQELL